jgi:hypothetical protein
MMFRVVFWVISSLMMEAVPTSETSVDNHFTLQYNPEDNSEHVSFSSTSTSSVAVILNTPNDTRSSDHLVTKSTVIIPSELHVTYTIASRPR